MILYRAWECHSMREMVCRKESKKKEKELTQKDCHNACNEIVVQYLFLTTSKPHFNMKAIFRDIFSSKYITMFFVTNSVGIRLLVYDFTVKYTDVLLSRAANYCLVLNIFSIWMLLCFYSGELWANTCVNKRNFDTIGFKREHVLCLDYIVIWMRFERYPYILEIYSALKETFKRALSILL